jgi:hypothetical protein
MDEMKRKTQERMERRSRKRSSSAGCEEILIYCIKELLTGVKNIPN